MSKTWAWGDLHLGHKNIITFTDKNGNRIRPFRDIQEHDWTLINNHNMLVSPEDRVYFFGDLAFNATNLDMLKYFNGRKALIMGNHDTLRPSQYARYFDKILAYRVYHKAKVICSHIPVHTSQMERFTLNIHGHTHANKVLIEGTQVEDKRYICICPEHTNFKPVLLTDYFELG